MSDIQDILKTAIANGVVDTSRAAFLLCQASTEIDRLHSIIADNSLLNRREIERLRGMLKSARFAVAIAITYSVKAEAKEHYRKMLADIDAALGAADQPETVDAAQEGGR